jgi:hypothetical protein
VALNRQHSGKAKPVNDRFPDLWDSERCVGQGDVVD